MLGDVPVEAGVVQIGRMDRPELLVTAIPTSGVRRLQAGVSDILGSMLGLSVDLSGFYAFAEKQNRLRALARRFYGVKPPRFLTVWEAMVNAVSCQQVSLTVGIILMGRLAERFGPAGRDGQHAMPRPVDLANARPIELREIGYSFRKAENIIDLARGIATGQFNSEGIDELDDEVAVSRLRRIKGIGRWSAQYVLLRGLRRLNVFPADDIGFQNKLGKWLHLDKQLDYEGVHRVIGKWRAYGGLIYFFMLLNHLAEQGHLSVNAPAPQAEISKV
ncbi:MAG: DNA-3-methyladenine glycosylase [Phycisphaerae bacterium]|nr:DNA-3-methyladenine glycosylase [Phycisphaerae bacterium]